MTMIITYLSFYKISRKHAHFIRIFYDLLKNYVLCKFKLKFLGTLKKLYFLQDFFFYLKQN